MKMSDLPETNPAAQYPRDEEFIVWNKIPAFQLPEPWRIEENHHGFLYLVDEDGKKVCTVYGSGEVKMQRAMAIAQTPVLLAMYAQQKGNIE